jgi:hypothetical protein
VAATTEADVMIEADRPDLLRLHATQRKLLLKNPQKKPQKRRLSPLMQRLQRNQANERTFWWSTRSAAIFSPSQDLPILWRKRSGN